MHNLVWVMLSIAVGLFFSFLSGGLFSADYSSFWPALGSVGTLGAWYFLYQQSKATNEQMRVANEQLRVSQIATYRTEIRHSIDRICEYLMDGENIRYDRLSWINASLEVENIAALITLLPIELRENDTERFGRLLDSKLPFALFDLYDDEAKWEGDDYRKSELCIKMAEAHKEGERPYKLCDMKFPMRSDLLKVFMFTRQYDFSEPEDRDGFRFRKGSFFYQPEEIKFKCHHCSNVI